MAPDENGWREYSKLVLKELEDHGELIEKLDDKVGDFRLEMTEKLGNLDKELGMLKIRAAGWGAIAGAVPGLIIVILKYR